MRAQSPKLYSALATLAGLLLIGCQQQDETARAQFVEVTAEINLTNYPPSKVGPPQWKFRAHCLIGSNCWIIQDNLSRNATCTYWFTGTNIVACARITKEPIAQDIREAEDWLSETVLGRKPPQRPGWRTPHRGKVLTQVIPSADGGPACLGLFPPFPYGAADIALPPCGPST